MSYVLTIGEPMAMFVADTTGPLDRIDHFTKFVAGAEINFSVGMTRLQHQTAYVTKLGKDPFGKYIQGFLQANAIDTAFVSFDSEHATGFQLKSKVVSGDPEVSYFRKNSAAANLTLTDIEKISWTQVDHLHVTGIPPALSDSCRKVSYELIARAKAAGVSVSFDPNLRPSLWRSREEMIQVINDLACRCDWVLPGINEGKILTGQDEASRIADFYLRAGVKTVVVKLGERGAYAKTADEELSIPAFSVKQVVDTVGAGDGFAVGVVSALLEGFTLPEAVRRGNAIGALAVMSPGDNDGLPTSSELSAYLNRQNGIEL